jgi:hypothetical protein
MAESAGLAGSDTSAVLVISGCATLTSFHAASAGRIREAILPGALLAAATAATASDASELAHADVRTQWLNGRAAPSISEVSGASSCR